MNRKPLCLICLVLALALMVTGCNDNSAVITPLPDGVGLAPPGGGEANLQSEGYYAPNTMMGADAPVVPAPAAATVDEIREAQQQRMTKSDYQQASIYTTIPKGDINIGLVVGEGMVLNPYRCPYTDVLNINNLVYESLVTLDENQQPLPQLADRWDISGDTWTFTLRPGIHFQDGMILVAEDVVESFNELMRNPSCYWYQSANNLIESVSVKDELTVAVKGKNGYTGRMLLYAMTFPIVQRSSMENVCPVGTGPYLLVQYDGNAVQLAINPVWWKRGTNLVPNIVGLCYPTVKDAVSALNQGYIDALASEYPTMSINRALSDRMSIDYVTTTYECIVPNLNRAVLKDFKVREALMYAIDRATLADTVYAGMVKESEVPVVPGTWLYEPQAAKYNYNPARALQLLYDDDWIDSNGDGILEKEIDGKIQNLSLKLFTYDQGTTSTRSEAAAAIAEAAKLVGMDIQVTVIQPEIDKNGDIKTTAASIARGVLDEGKFDLMLAAFELSIVPNLGFLFSSNGNTNYMRYKDDQMDAYLRQAVLAEDDETLQAAMSRVQLKIVDDLPIIGLFFRTGILTSKTSVRGLRGLRRGYALDGIATAILDTGGN